jgi:hypothetical protein
MSPESASPPLLLYFAAPLTPAGVDLKAYGQLIHIGVTG